MLRRAAMGDEGSAFGFDEAAARAAESFFDHVLVHVKGEWAGQPFTLEPWQREEVIRPLFGRKRPDGAHPDGRVRRYRVAYIEIPPPECFHSKQQRQ